MSQENNVLARKLKTALNELGIDIPLNKSYEAIAKMAGHKNWNVAQASGSTLLPNLAPADDKTAKKLKKNLEIIKEINPDLIPVNFWVVLENEDGEEKVFEVIGGLDDELLVKGKFKEELNLDGELMAYADKECTEELFSLEISGGDSCSMPGYFTLEVYDPQALMADEYEDELKGCKWIDGYLYSPFQAILSENYDEYKEGK